MKLQIEFHFKDTEYKSFKSVEEFLEIGYDIDPAFYTHFKTYYNPVIENENLAFFLHNIYVASLDTSLENSKLPEINILFYEIKNPDLTFKLVPLMGHIAYSLFLLHITYLNSLNTTQILNYELINHLAKYTILYISKYHPGVSINTKNLNYFFAKYLSLLSHYCYLEKVTDWIVKHRNVFYKFPASAPSIIYNPYLFKGISFAPYKIKNNMLITTFFTSNTNLYITNHKSDKTLEFINYNHPKLINQYGIVICRELLENVIDYLKSNLGLNATISTSTTHSKETSKAIQSVKLDELSTLLNMLKTNNLLYFAHSFDTRGRQYAISKFSITNCRYLRLCCINPTNLKLEHSNSRTYQKILPYFNNLKKYQSFNNKIDTMLFFLFLSLGFLVKPKNIYRIGLNQFLQLGMEAYTKQTNFDDLYDNALFIYYKTIINQVLSFGENVPNYMIMKDATASGWQHLGLYLGVNDEYKKFLNFDDTPLPDENDDFYWTDTYEAIIKSFKQSYKIPTKYNNYFNRKLLKPLIMTINYGATLYKCKNDIIDATGIKDAEFLIYVKEFFFFIKDLPWFKNPTTKLLNYVLEEKSILFSDANVDFTVYKPIKKKHDFLIGKIRETITFEYPSGDINNKKLVSSALANVIHASDGEVLRLMNIKTPSVHDCLLIGIHDICFILDSYEEAINKVTAKKIFNNQNLTVSSFFLLI